MSVLRKKLKDTVLNKKKYSGIWELPLEMEPLSRIDYSGRYDNMLTEITNLNDSA